MFDAIGAVASSTSLLLILPRLPQWIASPTWALQVLGIFATVVACISVFQAGLSKASWDKRLYRVIISNSTYLILTVLVLIPTKQDFTIFDSIYFTGEMCIIVTFVTKENEFRKAILKTL